jgi:hypothetical protein
MRSPLIVFVVQGWLKWVCFIYFFSWDFFLLCIHFSQYVWIDTNPVYIVLNFFFISQHLQISFPHSPPIYKCWLFKVEVVKHISSLPCNHHTDISHISTPQNLWQDRCIWNEQEEVATYVAISTYSSAREAASVLGTAMSGVQNWGSWFLSESH